MATLEISKDTRITSDVRSACSDLVYRVAIAMGIHLLFEQKNIKADRPRYVRAGQRLVWHCCSTDCRPFSLNFRAIPQSVDWNVATTLPALESASSLPETRKASTEASALARLLSSSIRAGSPAIFVLTSDPMVTESSMRA